MYKRQAFGTGTHETTRLCMELLEQYIKPNMDVLDVGCGSGILSVAALDVYKRQLWNGLIFQI